MTPSCEKVHFPEHQCTTQHVSSQPEAQETLGGEALKMPSHARRQQWLWHWSLSLSQCPSGPQLHRRAPHFRPLCWGREEEEGAGELGGSSSSVLLAEAAANFLWLALTTCLKALQCRKEIFQEIKLLLFPVWLSSLVYEKKALRALEKRFV